jgi:hypothetical protein
LERLLTKKERGGRRHHREPRVNTDEANAALHRKAVGASTWGLLGAVGFVLGILVGGFASVLYLNSFPADSGRSDSLASKNELLVTQQLDELFKVTERGLKNGTTEGAAYGELAETFYSYDMQFSSLNRGAENSRLASAYASKRIALIAQGRGNLDVADQYFRSARDAFATQWLEEPTVLGLYLEWLDMQLQIVGTQMDRGDYAAARNEHIVALRIAERASTFSPKESSRVLAPRFRSLVAMGMDLELYEAVLAPARTYVDLMRVLVKQFPDDESLVRFRADAEQLLNQVQSLAAQAAS